MKTKEYTVYLKSKGFDHPQGIDVKANNRKEALKKGKEKYKKLYIPTLFDNHIECWGE